MRQNTRRRRQKKAAVSRFQAEFSRSGKQKLTLMQRVRRVFIFTAVAALLAAACYFLLFSRLKVVGAPESIDGNIKDNGSLVFLPMFEPAALAQELKTGYPQEVAGVTVRHRWWTRTLLIEVETRSASMVLRTQGHDYSVDREGVVVGEGETDEQDLPLLVDRSNLETAVGKQAIPQQLAGFVVELGRSDLNIRQLYIIDTTSEVYADLSAGYAVRFATGSPLKVQLENLKRVQAIAGKKGDTITEYVDLRIPYKAYYR